MLRIEQGSGTPREGGKLGDWPPTGEIIRPLSGSITLPNSSVSVNSSVLELRDIPANNRD